MLKDNLGNKINIGSIVLKQWGNKEKRFKVENISVTKDTNILYLMLLDNPDGGLIMADSKEVRVLE